ncbi:B-cell receptor CD22-like isoform X3 [Sander vitreus]
MSLTAAASGFVVFLLSVQVIQGQYGWGVTYTSTQICAVKGSTVNIRCSYRYSYRWKNRATRVKRTLWFIKMNNGEPVDLITDSEYSGRVQHSYNNKDCSLIISDLRERDSAEYKFMFTTNQEGGRYTGSPGVTLSVTADPGLQVKTWYSNRLECQTSCRLPNNLSYVWYKNGQEIQAQTSYYLNPLYHSDSYSCALQGYKDFPSPSVCVRGESCNRVTYTERSICASEGSSVDISCLYNSYNYHEKSTFWFRRERNHRGQNPSQPEDLSTDPQYAGRVHVETERGRSTLRISDLRERDSAEYHFKFITPNFEWSSLPGTTLTVTALQVEVIRVYQSQTYAELKCHSSCSPAGGLSYVWFKNREHITWVETSTYRTWFNPTDVFSCALKRHEKFPSPSVYGPKLPSVSVSPSAEIVEGSSVTLTCSSDANPAARYTWYKTNINLNLQRLSEEPHLVFSSIRSSDSGQYYCTAENELGRRISNDFSANVKYGPKLPSVSVSPFAEIVEGSSVTLTCSSDANPAANYTWYKENQTLPHGQHGIYHFTSISSEDSGNYYCKSENQHGHINSTSQFIDVQYGPKRSSVSVSPSAEIVEGSSVNLTCSSDANPAANYTWYKENEDSPKASGQIFTITDIRAEHSGNYYCEAQNRRGRQNSTLHLIVVAGSMKSVAAGSITAIFLAIIFLCAFLFIRRKRSSKRTTEPGERPDNQAQVRRRVQSESSLTWRHLNNASCPLLNYKENMGSVYDSPSAPVQRTPAEQQDDLYYASVSFSKNQEDALYSNIRLAQPHRHKEEEEDEDVEYTTVNFKSASATTESGNQEAEDLYELYSTVSKHPRV